MKRPAWDFDYRPVGTPRGAEQRDDLDVVVATRVLVDPVQIAAALAARVGDVEVSPLLVSDPLFWTRVRSRASVSHTELSRALERAGIGVRYVASARAGSDAPAPPVDWSSATPRRPSAWRVRAAGRARAGQWFLGEAGIAVDRAVCGTGAGTRLAVIDNDAGSADRLELDACELVGVQVVPRGSRHGANLSAWAVGTRDGAFSGVAPDASLRHFYIPKPGADVLSLPLALARAVDDGADVVLCATHLEGTWSPLLDDALELAVRVGRRGLGTAVVVPTGRECSSAAGAVHATLTLGFGDPASDPRLICVGPSSEDGGWFLYQDRRGRLRPFANRGPAVRWLAPGADLADPFRPGELAHAESSGASAVAAGALLLVLCQNPDLSLSELEEIVTRTATRLDGACSAQAAIRPEVEPAGVDRDGHNAKHGYGRVHATRACLSARDPVAAALVSVGEEAAARAWLEIVEDEAWYSADFARWAARRCLEQSQLMQALSSLVRHVRLLAPDAARGQAHAAGAVVRQTALLLRSLLALRGSAGAAVDAELEALAGVVLASARAAELRGSWSTQVTQLARRLWADAVGEVRPRASLAAS